MFVTMDSPTSLLLLTFIEQMTLLLWLKRFPALIWKLIHILTQLKPVVGMFSECEYFFKANLSHQMYKMTQNHVL